MSKRKTFRGRDATITINQADGKKLGPYRVDTMGAWDFDELAFETSDAEFAAKLDKEFMMEDYEEEAKRRGVSLERLFALVIQEALEPIE